MNKDINAEIEAMANTLAKASTDPKEKLFSIIKALGPEGLKAKVATLSDEDKVLLKSALEEMTLQKAVSFDKEIESAKVIQGKITDTVIQEEIGSDDADEKLMKPSAAHQDHQGTPTDGWQGQVIKSVNESEELMDKVVEGLITKGMKEEQIADKCEAKGMDKKKVMGAIEKYKKKKGEPKKEDMEKASKMSKDEAKDKIMSMEEKEHKTKDPKKLVEAEKKEHMKKSEDEIEKAKMNKEEDQLGDAPNLEGGKQMAKKTSAPDLEAAAKDNKKNMTKSVSWDGEDRLLKANTQGRNFTFSVESFIQDMLTKGEPTEEVKKSEDTKLNTNDLIEKSMDRNWGELQHAAQMEANAKAQNGQLVKSFDDVKELAALYGISEEIARTIIEGK